MNGRTLDARSWKELHRRVAWTGVLVGGAVGLALLFATDELRAALGLAAVPATWPRFCGVLTSILAAFGIPVALDVDRHRAYAWLGVPARLAGFVVCAYGVLALRAPPALLAVTLPDALLALLQAWTLRGLGRAELGSAEVGAPSPRSWEAPAPATVPGGAFWRAAHRRITWAGVVLNALFFLPLVFTPELLLRVLGVGGEPVAWPRLFGALLAMISLLYVPTALDPDRYRAQAWLSVVVSRFAGVAFCTLAVVTAGADEAFLLGAVLDFGVGAAQALALSGLERAQRPRLFPRPLWRRFGRDVAVVGLGAAVLGVVGWHELYREYPQSSLDPDDEPAMFKYGSVGTEAEAGIPYWIWLALPSVFPEYLPGPGGYSSLGILWEEGAELPVGFSRKKIGFDRIGINCALCHAGAAEVPGEPRPRIYLGAPGNTVDVLRYQRFLFACANDPRFGADTLMPAIARQTRLSWIDAALYRFVLIPATRGALREQSKVWEWTREPDRPEWGRGRIEPFNPVKMAFLRHVDPAVTVGSTLGTSDMQSLWRLGAIPGRLLHWDGMNAELTEVVDSSALGDGATTKSIPRDPWLRKLQDWIATNTPPPFPYGPVDGELERRGAEVYRAECARCHAPDGEHTGQVMPIDGPDGVGTDDNRAKMWTKASADAYNAYLGDLEWAFDGFRSHGQYLCVPLDGLWLRAPYLHNGSVPTLADLLAPPAERPAVFWRGSTEYDPVRMGFVSAGARAEAVGTRYDTSGRGNGNQGHLFGTELPDEDKRALIEFLKTL